MEIPFGTILKIIIILIIVVLAKLFKVPFNLTNNKISIEFLQFFELGLKL